MQKNLVSCYKFQSRSNPKAQIAICCYHDQWTNDNQSNFWEKALLFTNLLCHQLPFYCVWPARPWYWTNKVTLLEIMIKKHPISFTFVFAFFSRPKICSLMSISREFSQNYEMVEVGNVAKQIYKLYFDKRMWEWFINQVRKETGYHRTTVRKHFSK